MMKYITAILIGWIGGATVSIGIDPVADIADNIGILAFWPVGLLLGYHSFLLSTFLVTAVIQLATVTAYRRKLPTAVPAISSFLLVFVASCVGTINLMTLGSQI
jgi:hypothetical protein